MPGSDSQPTDTPISGDSPAAPLAMPTVEGIPFTPASPQPEYLQPPRLGIIHLLALMTVTAILMKFYTAIAPSQRIELNYLLWFVVFQEIVTAAGLVGCGIILLAKIRHTPGYLQPGHWLLLYISLTKLEELVSILYLFYSPGNSQHFQIRNYLFLIVKVIALLWFALRIPEKNQWKILFRLWAILVAFPLILKMLDFRDSKILFFDLLLKMLDFLKSKILFFDLSLLSYISNNGAQIIYITTDSIIPIYLIVIVILDRIHGSQRDWLHWLGVCIIFWQMVSSLSFTLFVR